MRPSDHQALAAVARELAAELEVEQLLPLIVDRARRLFTAEATLYLAETDRTLVPRASTVPLAQAEPATAGQGLIGRCAQLRRGALDGGSGGTGALAMAHPLAARESLLAVIGLRRASDAPGFTPPDLDVLESFAIHAAIALHNARLHEEGRQRLRATTTLLAVAQALSRPGSMGDVMRRVTREIVRSLGAEAVVAYTLDTREDALRPVAAHGMPRPVVDTLRRMRLGLESATGLREAVRDQTVLASSDGGNDPRLDRAALGALPPHSMLFAPTVARGETIGGLLFVWWRVGREFHPAEVRLVDGMAAQVGLALENAELARQTEQKLRETETLLSISRALSSTLDLQPLLRHFLRRIAAVVDADGVGSYMLQEDGEWLAPLQGYRLPPDRLEALRALKLSIVQHPFYAEGARKRRPVFSQDAARDPRIPAVMREAAPHKSELFVPIVARGRVIGGLVAAWWDRVREFSDSELALIETIATQAGAALENARLFADNRRRVKQLSVLYELSQAVTGQLDRAALLTALQSHVARVFEVANILVVLRDEPGDDLVVALSSANGVNTADPVHYPPDGVGLLSVVLRSGRALRTDDYVLECERHGVEPVASAVGFPYWLGAPMTAGDRILGVLVLNNKERAFTAADERLLVNIAQLAALALRSAQLFEERARAYSDLAAAQDQLVRSEKLRALGEMASGVAHDFNNLLAAILGRAQLLLEHVRDERHQRWLKVIEQSAQDGAHTVRRLQEFTRIRRDAPRVAVDLNAVVRDALEITQSRWRDEALRRSISIEVRKSLEPLPDIAGDPPELREVMTNLILNAVDAMPNGGVLAVTTAVAGDDIEVTVSDTGIGMSEAVRARIFDPFFTTKGPKGTGLGLSMTYGIVTRHEAKIAVQSEEGKGTTFRLTFPRRAPSEVAETAKAPVPMAATPLRVLVVDDEPEVGSLLGDILESGGHKAVVLADGGEAIARAAAESFDLVFTDLAMPGVSGWQVARAIKTSTPGVPVFVITGFGVELSAEERERQGVDAVLVKPLEVNTVLRAVAEVAAQKTA